MAPAPKCKVQLPATQMHRKTASCCAHGAASPRQRAFERSMGPELGALELPHCILHLLLHAWKTSSSGSPTHSRAPTFPIACPAAPRALRLPGLQRLHPSDLYSTPHGRVRLGWQH